MLIWYLDDMQEVAARVSAFFYVPAHHGVKVVAVRSAACWPVPAQHCVLETVPALDAVLARPIDLVVNHCNVNMQVTATLGTAFWALQAHLGVQEVAVVVLGATVDTVPAQHLVLACVSALSAGLAHLRLEEKESFVECTEGLWRCWERRQRIRD